MRDTWFEEVKRDTNFKLIEAVTFADAEQQLGSLAILGGLTFSGEPFMVGLGIVGAITCAITSKTSRDMIGILNSRVNDEARHSAELEV